MGACAACRRNNEIGDEGVTVLAQALHLVPQLDVLLLAENSELGAVGATALARAVHHLPQLAFLFLSCALATALLPRGSARTYRDSAHPALFPLVPSCFSLRAPLAVLFAKHDPVTPRTVGAT
jgi:hypothetical protein